MPAESSVEEPQTLWSVPASSVPPTLYGMEVSPGLLESYKGHEALLKYRARHPPHCYSSFDAVRLCWLSVLEPAACRKAMESYRPCAREMRKAKLAKYDAADEARRKELNAAAKALEASASAGGSEAQR